MIKARKRLKRLRTPRAVTAPAVTDAEDLEGYMVVFSATRSHSLVSALYSEVPPLDYEDVVAMLEASKE